jgi:uncharacterized membrane protein YraQ (UPF0718 family)
MLDPVRLNEMLQVFTVLTLRIIILFIPITLGIVLLKRWLGDDRLARLMGGERLLPVLLKGVGLGAITPFCGCSTVPLLLGLIRAGARFGGVAAFMLASPLLNPYILGVVGVLFGVRLLAGYAALAVISSMVLGALWERAGLEAYLRPHVLPPANRPVAVELPMLATAMSGTLPMMTAPAPADPAGEGSCCGSGADATDDAGRTPGVPDADLPWQGIGTELRAARGPVIAQLRPMVKPVAIGLAIGALIYGFVPQEFVSGLLGETRWWTLPLAALLGLPLYLRGEAAFPIGAGLLAAGVGLGPMLAMVIAGMGASIPEVTILSGIFQRRLLAVFLASVMATALIGGALLPLLV